MFFFFVIISFLLFFLFLLRFLFGMIVAIAGGDVFGLLCGRGVCAQGAPLENLAKKGQELS